MKPDDLRNILVAIVADINDRLLDANPRTIELRLKRMGLRVSINDIYRRMRELVDEGIFVVSQEGEATNEIRYTPAMRDWRARSQISERRMAV